MDIIYNAHNLRTLALFNDENFNLVVETDILATAIKKEPDDEREEEPDFFGDNDNSNMFVQTELKAEDSTDSNDYRTFEESFSLELNVQKSTRGRKPRSKYCDYSKRIRNCRWCTHQFRGYHTLRKHESTVHPLEYEQEQEMKSSRHLGCSFCFLNFYASKDLNAHLKTVHSIDPDLLTYFCAHCSFSTNQKNKLESHIKTTHLNLPAKSYKCKFCSVRCISQQNLRKHLTTKHKMMDPNLLYCDSCNFTSKVKTKMTLHMQRVHLKTVNDFLCTQCDIVSQNKKERDLHHFAHSDIVELIDQSLEKLTCTICRELFGERAELLNHLESHRNDVEFKTVPCVLCYKPVNIILYTIMTLLITILL